MGGLSGFGNAGSSFIDGMQQMDGYLNDRKQRKEDRAYQLGLREQQASDRTEQRRQEGEDRAYQMEQRGEAKTDRTYQLGLREREASDYALKQKKQQMEQVWNVSAKKFFLSDGQDVSGVEQAYNTMYDDGNQAVISLRPNGYAIDWHNPQTGEAGTRELSKDEMANLVHGIAQDPMGVLKQTQAAKAAELARSQKLADTQSTQDFELKKLRTQYGLMGGLEKTKAAAEAGVGGVGKPTNAQKQYQELVAMGVPHQQAQGIAYGAFKAMTDPGSGAMVLYDVANGQEVGRMMSDNPGSFDSKKRFVPIGQQPKISYKDATTQAQQMAEDKAQPWNLDSTDFGPDGRDAWIKNTAAELMRNSTDEASAGGGLPVSPSEQVQAPPQGAGLRPLAAPPQQAEQPRPQPSKSALPPAPRDAAQRKVGQVYVAPDGRQAKWTGTGWNTDVGAK